MLQIDHIYEFFYKTIFKDCAVHFLPNGGVFSGKTTDTIKWADICVFNAELTTTKILFVDQEPIVEHLVRPYLEIFKYPSKQIYKTIDTVLKLEMAGKISYTTSAVPKPSREQIDIWHTNDNILFKEPVAIVVSEKSNLITQLASNHNLYIIYYFFHGFAALDWFRGFYSLHYHKQVSAQYKYDYIAFNRLVSNERSYRCYLVSLLAEKNIIDNGQISFGINDASEQDWEVEIDSPTTKLTNKAIEHIRHYIPTLNLPLEIDGSNISGNASADIPRCSNNSFWHIVTETVFYSNKLHLTEKIFKPIVMKQPFMLLAAPGNLAYLKSYGFKTFEHIIDERYDMMINPMSRVESVVEQLHWYCNLTNAEKLDIIREVQPIVEHNFHWFFTEFKHIITTELLTNSRKFFGEFGMDDSEINYDIIYKTLIT